MRYSSDYKEPFEGMIASIWVQKNSKDIEEDRIEKLETGEEIYEEFGYWRYDEKEDKWWNTIRKCYRLGKEVMRIERVERGLRRLIR